MLVIEVQLLAGRYVAIAHNQKATPDARGEWPPNPARLYSALVAALHDRDPGDPMERQALIELAKEAPELEVSNVTEDSPVLRRSVSTVYVPANDTDVLAPLRKLECDLTKKHDEFQKTSSKKRLARPKQPIAGKTASKANAKEFAAGFLKEFDNGAALLGEWRSSLIQRPESRSERTFPSVIPDRDVIRFGWPNLALDDDLRQALARLVERVTRLGHSSSLARCALASQIEATLKPQERTETADWVLRVPFPDQLDRLERAFTIHQAVNPRVLPHRPQGYRVVAPDEKASPEPLRGLFSDQDWIILAADRGGSVQLTRCVDIAKALHGALVQRKPGNMFISGRNANGKATAAPHLAVVPLPYVGHEHAHGGVLGVALVMPRGTSPADWRAVLDALVDWELSLPDGDGEAPWLRLQLHGGTLTRVRRQEIPELVGLRSRTWCRPAQRWLSVTPVALDRNPGNLASRSPEIATRAADAARECVREACTRVGLPAPLNVELSLSPLMSGSAHVRAFDPFPREEGRLRRVRLHAEILFDQKVYGPVLLGAGRFFGLGLFRPVE